MCVGNRLLAVLYCLPECVLIERQLRVTAKGCGGAEKLLCGNTHVIY